MIWALHSANVLILCSFLVRDILVLRLLSIAASALFCLYFHTEEMTEPIVWNLLFSSVNLAQIAQGWLARRKIPLCPEEHYLHQSLFPTLNPLEIRALFRAGSLEELDAGEERELSGLTLLLQGRLSEGDRVLAPGQFLGIQDFLEQGERAPQRAQARESLRCLVWPHQDLRAWAAGSAERNNQLFRVLSRDLLQRAGSR